MNHLPRLFVVLSLVAAASSIWITGGARAPSLKAQALEGPAKSPKPATVLFLCPRGAAKSVLASAYFRRAAKERGLNVQVLSAGTEPDSRVGPAIARHLQENGYEVPDAKPRRVTADEIASADVVIAIECDLKDLPAPTGQLLRWDDIPSTSEEFTRADEKIRERVLQLLEDLVRKQKG